MMLPDKPSELLQVALNDLKVIRNTPGYAINMGYWHTNLSHNKLCQVCFAGAVMANTLKIERTQSIENLSLFFDSDTRYKLKALNEFRKGHIWEGLRMMGHGIPDSLPPRADVSFYGVFDGLSFIKDMEKLIDLLQEVGV